MVLHGRPTTVRHSQTARKIRYVNLIPNLGIFPGLRSHLLRIIIGPVVRVAPNELSFNSAQSWKDIYSPRKDRAIFVKSDFYEGGNFADQASSIVSERDPERHSSMRKFLASAFSDRSLREQEGIVSEAIDKFISQVGERGNSKDGVDMTMWTNLLTFDIIGELGKVES